MVWAKVVPKKRMFRRRAKKPTLAPKTKKAVRSIVKKEMSKELELKCHVLNQLNYLSVTSSLVAPYTIPAICLTGVDQEANEQTAYGRIGNSVMPKRIFLKMHISSDAIAGASLFRLIIARYKQSPDSGSYTISGTNPTIASLLQLGDDTTPPSSLDQYVLAQYDKDYQKLWDIKYDRVIENSQWSNLYPGVNNTAFKYLSLKIKCNPIPVQFTGGGSSTSEQGSNHYYMLLISNVNNFSKVKYMSTFYYTDA